MLNLTNLSVIRGLMEENGLSFQKKFGQNFLTNPTVIERIADGCGENVLEIGPGIGVLTRALAARAKRVVAVEIDDGLIPVLAQTLADCPNVTVIHQDILKVDLAELIRTQFEGEPISVCANLPYSVTTPVLLYLTEQASVLPKQMTVMVQKEVAQRLTAKPGSAAYGAITVSLSYYGHAVRLFDVPAGNFYPVPKVDSSVVQFQMYDHPPVQVPDPAKLSSVIRGAFGQRRKTLSNALSAAFPQFSKDMIAEKIALCGFSPAVRGETLDLEAFASLTRALFPEG